MTELDAGNLEAYLKTSEIATRLFASVVAKAPDHRDGVLGLAFAYSMRGQYFIKLDSSAESSRLALTELRKSLVLLQGLSKNNPDDAFLTRGIVVELNNVAAALQRIGDSKQAALELRTATGMLSALIAKDPSNSRLKLDLTILTLGLSEILLGLGDAAGSVEAARTALTLNESLPEGLRSNGEVRQSRGLAHYALALGLESSAADRSHGPAQARAYRAEACQHHAQAFDILQDLKESTGLPPGETQPETIKQALQRCTAARQTAAGT